MSMPKRSDDPTLTPETAARKAQETTYAEGGHVVTVPDADPDWHPVARQLYNSMRESGGARFYESSDWAVLYSFCEDLSYFKSQKKRSAQMLSALNQVLTALLLTEGDRRKAKIELQTEGRETETEQRSGTAAAVLELQKYMEQRNERRKAQP